MRCVGRACPSCRRPHESTGSHLNMRRVPSYDTELVPQFVSAVDVYQPIFYEYLHTLFLSAPLLQVSININSTSRYLVLHTTVRGDQLKPFCTRTWGIFIRFALLLRPTL